ncbi:GTPase family protein [Planctomicrobium sp. SH668]|uniref:GTPase family protein n=1 Tax=Planctomicrobium sp. SH668 TaxID=3448126 RepID=UPI003F5B29F2
MWNSFRDWFEKRPVSQDEQNLRTEELLKQTPVPLIWLFGKTGSGKSSIVRYLTGVESVEIGTGFRPQTQFSSLYDFPTESEPVMRFLDTRGLGEVAYDPQDDLEKFGQEAHLMIVVVRAMDHAVAELVTSLRQIRKESPHRPIVLALTTLHEAYPGAQHPEVDTFGAGPFPLPAELNDGLRRSISLQYERFKGLFDRAVPIDLTPVEEGFHEPNFGGERLKLAIMESLPAAYRQTFIQLEELSGPLKDNIWKRSMPVILGTSTLAATAGAIPVPWVDIPVVIGLQSHLAYKLAKIHNQKLDAKTIAHVTGGIGGRIAMRMAIREGLKFIPWVGMAANAAAAFAYTFAGGMVWNWYFTEVRAGHIPTESELRNMFRDQLQKAAALWKTSHQKTSEPEIR